MRKEKYKALPKGQVHLLAAEIIMENLPFSNPDFCPKDKDACMDIIDKMLVEKTIHPKMVQMLAVTNIRNEHCLVDFNVQDTWTIYGGVPKSKMSRKQFLIAAKGALEHIEKENHNAN